MMTQQPESNTLPYQATDIFDVIVSPDTSLSRNQGDGVLTVRLGVVATF
jgi:hypothetical protein